jgi:hypothetical protein
MRLFLLIALAAPTAFGQLDAYTVTVTATSTLTTQPDQVGISVEVSAPLTTDVLLLVQSLGITIANLSSALPDTLYAGPSNAFVAGLDWYFTLTVPLGSLNGTLATLASLQQTIAQQNSPTALSFFITGLQVSPQLQASQQCPWVNLVADARAQAQVLASTAGFSLGEVSAISNGPPQQTPLNVVSFVGVFAAQIFEPAPLNPICTATVKFKLTPSGSQ